MLTSHLEWHSGALDRSLRSPFADRFTVKQHHATLGEISNKLVNVRLFLFLMCHFRNGHWSNWVAHDPSHIIFLNLKYPPGSFLHSNTLTKQYMTENTSVLCSVRIDSYAPSKYSLNYLIITLKIPNETTTNKKTESKPNPPQIWAILYKHLF